jgi:hypothetical protein
MMPTPPSLGDSLSADDIKERLKFAMSEPHRRPIRLAVGIFLLLPLVSNAAPSPKDSEALAAELNALGAIANLKLSACAAEIGLAGAEWNLTRTAQNEAKIASVREECPKRSILDLQPQLSHAKNVLKSKPKATSLLKEWFASWTTAIQNIPLFTAMPSKVEDNLTGQMNLVVTEAT